MQAIEFTSQLQDGMIPIPEPYKDWSKQPVRVILLTQELPHQMPIEANAWLGCMSGTGQIIGDIVSPIDDNLICWEVLAT